MHEADVVVIGAGAAGVAAARRLDDARLSVLVVEARNRVGGRAWTLRSEGLALDLGCGWLHSADENEWAEIAKRLGFVIDELPPPWARSAHPAGFPPTEQREFRAARERLYARLAAAAGAGDDAPAAQFLEPGNRWNPLLDAMTSYANGAGLAHLTAREYARYRETGINWRVVEGYGTLIAAHAAGLRVMRDCPATLIDHSGSRVRVATPRGDIAARAVITTVPPGIIADGPLRFSPALSDKEAAAAALPLGLADKVFLRLDDAEDLPPETRLFGATDTASTGSYHLRPFGLPLIEGYFGGDGARALEREGEGAFAAFAIDEIAIRLGSTMRKRLHPLAESAWERDPFARGAYSYGSKGAAAARAALSRPVDDRLFFAGEACSDEDFSTAHGAYRTGIAAAEQVMRALVPAGGMVTNGDRAGIRR
jgi:monoamine oxidase